jgi:periplasmic divalent cation tolerance protein
MASDLRILFVTIGADDVDAFVSTLCRERLVACGNILPQVRSYYWWDGELQQDAEAIVLMETVADRVDAAMARAAELHPYEVPKIVVLKPDAVNAPYFEWARAQTRPSH